VTGPGEKKEGANFGAVKIKFGWEGWSKFLSQQIKKAGLLQGV